MSFCCRFFILFSGAFVLVGCGNPGGVGDEFYNEFKMLASPKILYSCTVKKYDLSGQIAATLKCADGTGSCDISKEEYTYEDEKIGYTASRGGVVGYNSLLFDAKEKCTSENGVFEVIEGVK